MPTGHRAVTLASQWSDASLSGLALAAVACATKPPPPPTLDHRQLVAEVGWAQTLRAVDEFCDWGRERYDAMHCTMGSRGDAYIAAYEDFWPDRPIEVRVEAVSTEHAAALVGGPIPDTAPHNVFVLGVRVRFAKPPPGIRWNPPRRPSSTASSGRTQPRSPTPTAMTIPRAS